MTDLIKYAVSCTSLYGIIALTILFIGFSILGIIIYKIIQLVLLYVYKLLCKHFNTVKKYNEVRTKIDVNDVSLETELHQ